MTRPALYYTVQRNDDSFGVMRVTRITDLRVYGSMGGISTHCAPDMTYGKFDTHDAAAKALAPIKSKWDKFAQSIATLELDIQFIKTTRDTQINIDLRKLTNAG